MHELETIDEAKREAHEHLIGAVETLLELADDADHDSDDVRQYARVAVAAALREFKRTHE